MTKTFKRKVTMSIAILLAVILLFQRGITTSKAETRGGSSPTVEGISQVLDDYMESKGLNIKKGTLEYVRYLQDMLMFKKDNTLKSMDEYQEIKVYAANYIVQYTEDLDGLEKDLEIPLKMKNKTISNLIEESKREEAIEEIKIANSHVESTFRAVDYSPSNAVAYALKYANSRNKSQFLDFGGKNCTNYVSQAILAGGKGMKMPTNICQLGRRNNSSDYWYNRKALICGGGVSNREIEGYSTAWTTVVDFHTYWKGKGGGTVLNYTSKSTLQNNIKIGDIIQLNDGDKWFHSIIVTSGKKGDWKFSGNSFERKNYPVSNLNSIKYRIIRIK